MEDDEFGFTKREESLLEKVSSLAKTRDKNNRREEEKKSSRAGAVGVVDGVGEGTAGSGEYSVDGGGSAIPPAPAEEYEKGVSSGAERERDGSASRSRSGGKVPPETGSEAEEDDEDDDKRSNQHGATESVSVGAPNIPNVVEYHLKVKPNNRDPVDEFVGDQKSLDVAKNDARRREKMRNDCGTPVSSREDKKILTSTLSKLSIDNNVFEGSTDLPQVFQVKYLGSHDARGLWGIKHTRKPVDNMVATAKSLPTDTILPLVKLVVSEDGVSLLPIGKRKFETASVSKTHPIESISYGVQDLVYTRVFSMIVVRDNGNFRRISPFECHAFVCESKHHARQLTYALATAFQIYSKTVKSLGGKSTEETTGIVKKRFAIDLRSPEEIETDLNLDSEA